MSRIGVSFKKFNREVINFGKTLIATELPAFQQKLAIDVLTGVVEGTPVLTGHARFGWQVSLDQPIEDTIDGVDKDGGPTISRGAAVISQARPFSVIYISNNVPYILELEEGSSQNQAPQGMVAITLQRLEPVELL